MRADVLRDIRHGMKVVDSSNSEIGEVDWVQYGDDDPATPEPEAAGVSPIETEPPRTVLEAIADVFLADGLPREIQDRLLLQGFVRIDADGLFAADRYVTPQQIAGVADGRLVLSVSKSDLLRRE